MGSRPLTVAIVGATGAVGIEFLRFDHFERIHIDAAGRGHHPAAGATNEAALRVDGARGGEFGQIDLPGLSHQEREVASRAFSQLFLHDQGGYDAEVEAVA